MLKLKIKKHQEVRIVKGSLWVFSNEIENFAELKTLEKGSVVEVVIKGSQSFALAYFNPHSLIAARILTYDCSSKIDQDFFVQKISVALKLREKFFSKPFYRLIHSEGDFLPGLVIDRFNDVFSCQVSTAGMEKLTPIFIDALNKIFSDAKIILRNDVESRKLESLELKVTTATGEVPQEIEIEENGVKFFVDVHGGQKTGWFYDQRKNREFIGSISKDCDVLDAFCYFGGFGLNSLKNGAKSVTFIDSSQEAINKVRQNISLNNFSSLTCNPDAQPKDFASQTSNQRNEILSCTQNDKKVELITGKVFESLEKLESRKRRFDIVLLDPPAFIKSKKDFFSGIKGYEKLIRLAADLVKENGILMLTSCSHHANINDLTSAANDGFRKSNRKAKLIRTFGADIDHPIHPALKENEYLKSITFIVE